MRDCDGVGEIWDGLGVERMEGVGFGDTREWIEEMMKGMGMRECVEFVTGCWAIWEDRNKLVFEGEGGDVGSMVRRVRDMVWEMRDGLVSETICGGSKGGGPVGNGDEVGWRRPRPGVMKINVDAAVLDGFGVGWGCIGHDGQGRVLWCTTIQQREELDVSMAEAVGIWHGLKEAAKHGYQDVEIENDCAAVVLFVFVYS
ncbi:uncharacterized protein LOC141629244 [Silene latifolia]|uniref:uncharacterized protein LOC141629244 n=1 Tax=Silene latifolia TaxID=37657 RepID=UPI003D76AFD5